MEGAVVRMADHSISFSAAEEELKEEIEAALSGADFATMPDADGLVQSLGAEKKQIDSMLRALQDLGRVVALEGGLFLQAQKVEQVRDQLRLELEEKGQIKVAEFRDLIGSNRRYALALLSLFDNEGLTQRSGDVRTLKK